ncbi:MAG: hypothetical protein ACREAC_03940, partial [Blastocatellia bacterium]
MRRHTLMFAATAVMLVSAAVSYGMGLEIVKDPWNVAETHSGFASTISKLAEIDRIASGHYQYAMARDRWTDPLQIADQNSRLASLMVRVRQET